MKGKSPDHRQLDMFNQRLADQLNPKHPLYRLGNQIPWDTFEDEFSGLYSSVGRNAHPIRLMVGLLILKQLRNLSDEFIVARWLEMATTSSCSFFCSTLKNSNLGDKFI